MTRSKSDFNCKPLHCVKCGKVGAFFYVSQSGYICNLCYAIDRDRRVHQECEMKPLGDLGKI